MRLPIFLLSLILLASSVPAFAAPGELDAVIKRCGIPGGESKEISQVTNQLERTLIYNGNSYLHFEPVAGGWAFTSAWNGHLPMSRKEVENRMPCFHQAMQDAANAAPNASGIDPAIAQQSINPTANDATFGIPHFALIVFLVITLIVFLLLPSARQRQVAHEQAKPIERVYRQPNLDEYTSAPIAPQPLAHEVDREIDQTPNHPQL